MSGTAITAKPRSISPLNDLGRAQRMDLVYGLMSQLSFGVAPLSGRSCAGAPGKRYQGSRCKRSSQRSAVVTMVSKLSRLGRHPRILRIRSARATRPSRSITRSVARAAAAARSLPPNVEP